MAQKDAKKIKRDGLKPRVENLLSIIQENPFQVPPSYEKLVGDLNGAYSRRINIQHRLVYQVLTDQKIVKIIRMWKHYR
jgi:toxin YoeB